MFQISKKYLRVWKIFLDFKKILKFEKKIIFKNINGLNFFHEYVKSSQIQNTIRKI